MFQLIKNNRDQQPRMQRCVDIILTTILWVSWLVLWLPLIPLFGWVLGHDLSEFGLPIDEGPAFLKDLKQFFINVALIGSGLIAWSSTAIFLSRWKERRKDPFPVTREQQARRYAVAEDQLAIWQKRSVVKISFTPDGTIDYVEADSPSIPEPQQHPQSQLKVRDAKKRRELAKRKRRKENERVLQAKLLAAEKKGQMTFSTYNDDLKPDNQDEEYHPWLVENMK